MKMKRVKFTKKRNKRRRKNKKFKIKFSIIYLILILVIIFILLLYAIKLIIKDNVFEKYDPEIMTYKGEKVQKKKLIEDFLTFSLDNDESKLKEKNLLYKNLYLDDYPRNTKKIAEIKTKFISQMKNNQTKKIDIFYLRNNCQLGNSVISVNNAIFYCEIVGCKKILLKEDHICRKWLITNPIYIKKLDITIMLGRADCNDDNVLCLREGYWNPFYSEIVKPQVRTQYIKEELLRNLPNVKTEPNDLYIHLRGGDIFMKKPSRRYAQPPLCFYEKVIDNNKFKNIYIIASDRRNVVLDALINKYKYIIYEQHEFNYDFALLAHAYNLAISVSTFALSAVKFNDNLKNLWEYDICRISQKYHFLHHHLYKFNYKYKVHTMKPSDIYAHKMFRWDLSQSQLKLMLEDKCTYDFVLTKPN